MHLEHSKKASGQSRRMRVRGFAMALLTAMLAVAAAPVIVHALGLNYEPPAIHGFEPLDDGGEEQNPLTAEDPRLLDLNTGLFRDTAIIDFEKRQITFMRIDKRFGVPVWRYHYDELDQYLASRQQFAFRSGWSESERLADSEDDFRKGISQLDFQLPVHYPAWARRVLGKEPPKLTIDGYQEIGIAVETGSVNRGLEAKDKTPGLEFVQNNDFTIRGSVGRLINIEMRAGSDQEFDISNPMEQLKIVYKEDSIGELEDEIIQEVVAGWTNFEMPGGGLVGFAESHEGLFGIKVRSKFGPLSLTSIVSQEQGQLQKKEIRPNQAGGNNQTPMDESEFVRNRFFFLDSLYLRQYLGAIEDVPVVSDLRVYKWVQGAVNEKENINDQFVWAKIGDEAEPRRFQRMWENEQYELFDEEGYVRFADTVNISNNDLIAIYMETGDPSRIPVKGNTEVEFVKSVNDTAYKNLWVLKNANPDSADSTWWLMWRNVYRMPQGASLESFDLTVRNVTGDTSEQVDNEYFAHILQIADESGQPLKQISDIYDFNNGYLIVPPYSDTTRGNLPFANPALGKTDQKRNTNYDIYKFPQNEYTLENVQTQYQLVMTGETKDYDYNLGWGIMHGSVKVTRGHSKERLQENRDYRLNYDIGQITFISERAKTADLIEVEYQQESFFVFDKRNFLGLQGQVDLPQIGKNSHILGRVLYQNTTTDKDVPKIGHEPYNKLAFEANTKFDFEPDWMTQMVNYLPLIKTSATSSASFDAKVARTSMDPNSGGEAYIDNFESADSPDDLGLSQYSWRQASPPADFLEKVEKNRTDGSLALVDSLLWRPPAWHSYWFTPEGKHRVLKESIWILDEEELELTSDSRYATTMRWVVDPAPDNELADQYSNPWAGIMTSFPVSQANRESDQFLEIWVKNSGGGKLYVDMGDISEQLSLDGGPPNDFYDREDTSRVSTQITYNPQFDRGLDFENDEDEQYLIPDLDNLLWDTLGYGNELLGQWKTDPARDNFRDYSADSLDNAYAVNGTQGNERAETEDVNLDGIIEPSNRENVFRAVVDFDNIEESPFLDENTNAASPEWRRIVIPVNNAEQMDVVGKPSWERIRFVRLWWSDFSDRAKKGVDSLEFARIQFVGNKWMAAGDTANVRPSVLNTKDDPAYYPPPLKHRERPQGESDRFADDYALRLQYGNVYPGEEALVEQNYPYQNINLSSYEKIRMYVRFNERIPTDPSTWFVYRFGRDDSTFYEFRQRAGSLQKGWTRGVEIDLKELARLKLDYLIERDNTIDSMDLTHTRADGSQYRIQSKTGITPTFSDIKWMALGVARDEGGLGADTGEVWVNGLRVSGSSSLSGWAFTGNISTRWADFMDVSVDMSYEDADFRQMSENLLSGRDSRMAGSVSAQWSLDKFLPAEWGVSVPLGAGLSSSLSRPKLKPNSDISLTDAENKPDDLSDMAEDFAGKIINRELSDTVTDAEHYETWSVNRSWYTSYSKSGRSKNPLVNLTADRISANYRYVEDTSSQALGQSPEGMDYVDERSTESHTFGLKYDLSPRNPPKWTSWRPFAKATAAWLPRQLKDYKLSLLPRTISFDVADIDLQRIYGVNSKTENITDTRKVGLDHGFELHYEPIAPILDAEYRLTIGRDLSDALKNFDPDTASDERGFKRAFIEDRVLAMDTAWNDYFIAFGEDYRSQHFRLEFDPEFVEWLSHRFNYTADYNHSPQQRLHDPTAYLSSNVTSKIGFSSDLRIHSLFANLAEKTERDSGGGNFFGSLEKNLGKINLRSFNFNYNVSSTLKNDYLDAQFVKAEAGDFKEFMLYQLGFLHRWHDRGFLFGDMDDQDDFGGMDFRKNFARQKELKLYENDQRSVQSDISISTSMRLPHPIDLDFTTMSLGWRKSYTREPDTTQIDTTITWPEARLSAQWSILEKISFIKNLMRSISLSSGYTHSRSRTVIGRNGKEVRIDTENRFDPLASIRGTLKKWPVNINYSYDQSFDSSYTDNSDKVDAKMDSLAGESSGDNGKKTISSSHTFEINHSIRSSRLSEIKVFRWTIPIKGELAMGMEAEHASTVERIGGDEQSKTSLYSITPHMAYDFTTNVRGTASYSGIWKKQKGANIDNEETDDHKFSLLVRITF